MKYGKVYKYYLRGWNYIFFVPLNWGKLLKERICSCKDKFSHLKVNLFLEKICQSWKQNRKSQKLFPCIKNDRKTCTLEIVGFSGEFGDTLKCLNIGTLKTINFSFAPNGKLMIFMFPTI